MLDIVVGLLALILLFFLPGFLLVLIIFPKRGALSADFDIVFKGMLGIVLSIVISIAIGIILYGVDSLAAPPDVQSLRLWVILSAVSIALGIIAWRRSAFRSILPKKTHIPGITETAEDELNRLTSEKRKLQERLVLLESDDYKFDDALKEEASVRIPALKQEIERINRRIDEIVGQEEKIAQR